MQAKKAGMLLRKLASLCTVMKNSQLLGMAKCTCKCKSIILHVSAFQASLTNCIYM